MGLALENFDAAGSFRERENGQVIDTSGSLDGKQFSNPAELGAALSTHPSTSSCLVNRLYSYSVGRPIAGGEKDYLKYLENTFADNEYRLIPLLRAIATSEAFYRVAQPEDKSTDNSDLSEQNKSSSIVRLGE